MMDFFSADYLDANMKKKINGFIDEYKHREFDDLIERDWQSGNLICPFCRTVFRDYTFFLRHFRYRKHRWELKLLQRIYKYGPKKLEVFDTFYKDRMEDGKLHEKVRLWVLALKIFEFLDIMPYWKTNTEFKTKEYVNRLFWEKDKETREN